MLNVLIACLMLLLAARALTERKILHSERAKSSSTIALPLAKLLRNNSFLRASCKLIFERIIPIVIALQIVVLIANGGWYFVSRVLLNAFLAAGHQFDNPENVERARSFVSCEKSFNSSRQLASGSIGKNSDQPKYSIY